MPAQNSPWSSWRSGRGQARKGSQRVSDDKFMADCRASPYRPWFAGRPGNLAAPSYKHFSAVRPGGRALRPRLQTRRRSNHMNELKTTACQAPRIASILALSALAWGLAACGKEEHAAKENQHPVAGKTGPGVENKAQPMPNRAQADSHLRDGRDG